MQARIISSTSLGKRPDAVNNLNGESFQQDPLVTHNGWQYCAAYIDKCHGQRLVQLSRRKLSDAGWEHIVFHDHLQESDDGHNVICFGISHQDGSMHISWDLHSSRFNYRQSRIDLVSEPDTAIWSVDSFGPVLHQLPGLEQNLDEASPIRSRLERLCLVTDRQTTYPRFLSLPRHQGGALLFDLRTGISGLGDEWLYVYYQGQWRTLGIYLKGVMNNAYINGMDLDSAGTLHVTWCYRDYVDHPRGGKPQQAGPNGPENNHDLCYAYSPLEHGYPGRRWYSQDGTLLCDLSQASIEPRAEIVVFEIPKYSGILNQEAQCLSPEGVQVLNRENVEGVSTWFHYRITAHGNDRQALPCKPLSYISARGKLVCWRGQVLALLQLDKDLVILDTTTMAEIGRVPRAGGKGAQEVLYDRHRSDALSLFLGIDGETVVVDLLVE